MLIQAVKADPRLNGAQKDRVSAFQRIPSADGVKRGFICEADSISEAIIGIVELVAKHCAATGQHPAHIIERMEVQ